MKIAIITSGGVGQDLAHDVIPCFLWLIERLTAHGDEVHVFCLSQGKDAGSWPLLGATVHNAGRNRGLLLVRQVMREHRNAPFDVIHTLWSLQANAIAAALGKLAHIPVLLYFGARELTALPGVGKQDMIKNRIRLKIATAGADRIAAQSAFMVEEARSHGIAAERVALGVALDRWPVLPPRRRASGAPVRLLRVAHLVPWKDYPMLLDAAHRLSVAGLPFELDVIGIDVLNGAIQRQAQALGLSDRIRFHGFLPHQAMRPFFERADIHVVTSLYEAGPLAVLEAAIAGVPTVGTRVGHLAEWTSDAAQTVETRDSAGLAQAIATVSANEEMRLSMASRAQELAAAENADVTTRRFRDIYLELSRASRRSAATATCSG